MDVFYWKVSPSNFGDELNTWIWPRVLPDLYDYKNESHIFVGIGTLINHKLPEDLVKIIFGSGVGYGDVPKIDDSYKIYFVRGPLSAKVLNLQKDKFITDPAILLSDYRHEISPNSIKKYKISFIPHYISQTLGNWHEVCENIGIHCISPFGSIEEVSADIISSDYVLTDAMHGAILADAFRVPWMVVHPMYNQILEFKWRDWAGSMNVNYDPISINCIWRGDEDKPVVSRVKNVVKRGLFRAGLWNNSWTMPDRKKSNKHEIDIVCGQLTRALDSPQYNLSKDDVFKTNLARCKEKIETLKNDIADGSI